MLVRMLVRMFKILDFTDACHPNHITLLRKSAVIQNPSAQIPKALYQHGIAEKTKNYLSMNALMYPTV